MLKQSHPLCEAGQSRQRPMSQQLWVIGTTMKMTKTGNGKQDNLECPRISIRLSSMPFYDDKGTRQEAECIPRLAV